MPNPVTTIGKVLINDALPEGLRDENRIFNKKESQALFTELAQKYPEQYVQTLHKLNTIARMVSTEYGREASLSLSDLSLPPRIKAYRKTLQAKIQALSQDPNLTMHDKNDRIVKVMREAIDTVQKNLEDETLERNNSFALSIRHGFRGSPKQLTQLLFGNMLVADHKGNPIPVAGLRGYGEGVSPAEYWADSYGSRKGFFDVQFATAQTGYFGKQLALTAQRLKITAKDCGASNVGLPADGRDPELIGSVLAKDVNGIPAGTVIGKENLNKIGDKKVLIRSVATCQQKDGICQLCAGKSDQNNFPPMGSYIGINAARVISEPMTQELGLSAKHVGGTVGAEEKELSPFEEINQFLQVPQSFRGAAALAPVDGKVSNISEAPQGGAYIDIGDQQIYVPRERRVLVSKNQNVEAGDILSDGTPNPAEIVQHKGLGAGRAYFVNKFYNILKSNGIPTHRRNVEVISRAFMDKVRITEPDGILGFSVGELVPYSELQRDYEPRKDSEERRTSRAVGMYLERPIMHYTIGTRITPNIAKELGEAGFANLVVNKVQPGFEPEIMRIMDIPSSDRDWKTRLAGFGLKKSFLAAATKGSTSPHESTSYIPGLLNPEQLD